MTARVPTGQPLTGRWVRLDVLGDPDVDDLAPIVSDPVVYSQGYLMHRRPTSADDARRLVRDRFIPAAAPDGAGAGRTAYAIRLVADGPLGAAGTVVGTSSLGDADVVRESIHLGWTMYGSRGWGTQVNPEAKLLLMTHAFEDCGFGRVKIQTDVLNARSQAAIAKLGAVREGVTRREQPREDGSWRDSVVFSVLVDEWPEVKQGLLARLG